MIKEYFEFIEQVKKAFNDMLCHGYYQAIEIAIPDEFATDYVQYELCSKIRKQFRKRIEARKKENYGVDFYIAVSSGETNYKFVMCLWLKPSRI